MATMVWVVGLVAASLLAFSGYAKIKNSGSLALSLLNLGFKDFHVSAMIKAIPATELVVGVVSLGILLRSVTPWLPFIYLILGMFYLAFALVVMILNIKGYAGDCGCFGDWLKISASVGHVMFNLAISVILIYGGISGG